jgi:hypothetical protein
MPIFLNCIRNICYYLITKLTLLAALPLVKYHTLSTYFCQSIVDGKKIGRMPDPTKLVVQ